MFNICPFLWPKSLEKVKKLSGKSLPKSGSSLGKAKMVYSI